LLMAAVTLALFFHLSRRKSAAEPVRPTFALAAASPAAFTVSNPLRSPLRSSARRVWGETERGGIAARGVNDPKLGSPSSEGSPKVDVVRMW
jgi:hypothetical protein